MIYQDEDTVPTLVFIKNSFIWEDMGHDITELKKNPDSYL